MITRGHYVIFFIFALALAMGSLAVWWHDQQGERAQAFWGTQTANVIRHAPQVEALQLGGSDETARALLFDGKAELHVLSVQEVTLRPGLVHARHALIDDLSFDWSATAPMESPRWTYALRFTAADSEVTVLIDIGQGQVRKLNGSRGLQLVEEIRQALASYLGSVFVEPPVAI